MKAILYTDGGSRGNPGPAAIGGVLYSGEGTVLASFSEYLGEKTNNEAEYLALLKGLMVAGKLGVTEISCYLDSSLVVNQLNGLYKVKNIRMQELVRQVRLESGSFKLLKYQHIPREKNKNADTLVNKALDGHFE
jgi:ribonuclease HI